MKLPGENVGVYLYDFSMKMSQEKQKMKILINSSILKWQKIPRPPPPSQWPQEKVEKEVLGWEKIFAMSILNRHCKYLINRGELSKINK